MMTCIKGDERQGCVVILDPPHTYRKKVEIIPDLDSTSNQYLSMLASALTSDLAEVYVAVGSLQR